MNSPLWDGLNQELVACRLCPRLVSWREEVARVRKRAYRDQDYWGRPVPGFGDHQARLLVVGLAPGAHGSNRTGRMFTGDASGEFLYASLYRTGFANQPGGRSPDDGLELRDLFITAACRCVPPANKPTPAEVNACRPFLLAEMALLSNVQGIVALGKLGFDQVLAVFRQCGVTPPEASFAHAALVEPGSALPWLMASYHPSPHNTLTGRMTPAMFDAIWQTARDRLK